MPDSGGTWTLSTERALGGEDGGSLNFWKSKFSSFMTGSRNSHSVHSGREIFPYSTEPPPPLGKDLAAGLRVTPPISDSTETGVGVRLNTQGEGPAFSPYLPAPVCLQL